MKNKVSCIVLACCLSTIGGIAQEKTFDRKVKDIAKEITNQTIQQKEILKIKVDSLNVLVENNTMTDAEAQVLKETYAKTTSATIEGTANVYRDSLTSLVQDRVTQSLRRSSEYEEEEELGGITGLSIGKNVSVLRTGDDFKQSPRNAFRLVFTYGMSNLATEGSFANSGIKNIPSNFIQWGFSINSRLLNKSNLLHLNYGVLLEYTNLKPTGHNYFVEQEDGQVVLSPFDYQLDKSRLAIRTVQIPLFLEFDFSKERVNEKTGRKYFVNHDSWKFGVGGFMNINRKKNYQVYHYAENGKEYRVDEKSNLPINKVRYGLGAYVGYGSWSIYGQYELTPLFKNNTVNQNVWSLGLRIDL